MIGDGPRDLVWVPGWISNVEAAWGEPTMARFFERLASFSRLILFDKRGTGLSDRVPDSELPSLETRTDDVRSVCDAIGSEQTRRRTLPRELGLLHQAGGQPRGGPRTDAYERRD